jgi:hypothetical protein
LNHPASFTGIRDIAVRLLEFGILLLGAVGQFQ